MTELQQFCSLTLYVVSLFKMNTIRRIEPEEKGAPLVWFEPAGQEHLFRSMNGSIRMMLRTP